MDQLLDAKTLKQITITESHEDDDGVIRYRDMKKVIEVADNPIQMRAVEHASDLLGSTKETGEGVSILIIHRVGRGSRSRFARKLEEEGKHGKNGKETTKQKSAAEDR